MIKKSQNSLETIAFLVVGIGVIIYIFFLILTFTSWGWEIVELGFLGQNPAATIGTFLGGVVTPIFTLASVFFFYSALSTQKEELRQAHEIFTKQHKSIDDQAKTLRQQRFETTFFNMLKNNLDLLKDIEDKHSDNKQYGSLEKINKLLYADSYNSNIDDAHNPTQILLNIIPDFQQHLKRVFLLLELLVDAKFERHSYYIELVVASMQSSEFETFLTFCLAKNHEDPHYVDILTSINRQSSFKIHEDHSPKYLNALLENAEIKYNTIKSPSA